MEILVLHPGALGDIILSLPALGLLRRHTPGSRLTLAGNLDFVQAVSGGYADFTRSLATVPLHRLYSQDPLPDEDVRFWRSYDRVVSWTGAEDPAFAHNLGRACRCVRVAAWRPVPAETRHVARIFADSLVPWIPAAEQISPALIRIDDELRKGALDWLAAQGWTPSQRLLALHAGAGSAAKRWDREHFLILAQRYLRQGTSLLLVEGPAEPGLGRQLSGALHGQVLLAESLPLALLAGLLSCCSFYVGNDSGISHLAAAVGVRSVVLFGPTSPEHWAPLGERVTFLRDPSLSRITPAQVRDALESACTETDRRVFNP